MRIIFLALILISAPVFAAKDSAVFVTSKSSLLACWDASATPSVSYNLYIDGGKVNSKPILKTCLQVNINQLWAGKIKTVTVRAVNKFGVESVASNKKRFRLDKKATITPNKKPNPVTNLRLN